MVHREVISIEDYTNEFEIPYLAEFADTFRKYVVKSGVKSCFCLDMPVYLPGQLKPVQIMIQRKGSNLYACQAGALKVLFECDNTDLKSEILKGFQFTREWDDEFGEVYFYGIHVSAKIFCQMDIDFSFKKIVTGVYRISDNGWLKHETKPTSEDTIKALCNTYDVEYDGKQFEITLPNISTKYSIRKFFDFLQFICAYLY